MDNRPFYELDDDEILIEEAAEAALSNAVTPIATTATLTPALPLRCPLRCSQFPQLFDRYAHKQTWTLLDHAYLVNMLACTVNREDTDVYGFQALLREESTLLLLDQGRRGDAPRSNRLQFPHEGVQRLSQANLDYTGLTPPGLSLRLERDALLHFQAHYAQSTPFFAIRRFTLALMPQLTKEPLLTDIIEQYTVSARIFINSAAAKQAFLSWDELALLVDADTESDARKVLEALKLHPGVLDA